jgi:SAM-dependent methyltransferase
MTISYQSEYWNTEGGARWVRTQPLMDALFARHGEIAMDAASLDRGESVLDVGCGCGDTTLTVARRVGLRGTVVGVDISAPMLEQAERRVATERLPNVRFELGDVATHPLPEQHFDAVISRFGIMFFEDPPAAFGRIHRALKRGGRFAAVCWRRPDDNPWITTPRDAVAPFVKLNPVDPAAPGPFSLASNDRVHSLLAGAGFDAIRIEPLDLPLTFGRTEDEAAKLLVLLGPVGRALSEETDEVRIRAIAAIATSIAPFRHGSYIEIASGAWLVTARRAD